MGVGENLGVESGHERERERVIQYTFHGEMEVVGVGENLEVESGHERERERERESNTIHLSCSFTIFSPLLTLTIIECCEVMFLFFYPITNMQVISKCVTKCMFLSNFRTPKFSQ